MGLGYGVVKMQMSGVTDGGGGRIWLLEGDVCSMGVHKHNARPLDQAVWWR